MRMPELRRILEGLWPDIRQYAVGDSDVADRDRPAKKPPWKKHMAGLLAKERDGLRRLDGEPHDCAGRSVDAARQVYGDDGAFLRVHGFNHRPRQALYRTIEARAE